MTTSNSSLGLEPSKPPEDDNRMLKIKKLKAKLINEEHRLVLMKKIRQSQTRPIPPQQQQQQQQQQQLHQTQHQANNSQSGVMNSNNISANHHHQLKKLRPHQSAAGGSMSIQKTQPQTSHSQGSSSATDLSSNSPSLNQTPAHAHQRPKVNTLWNPPQQARHPTPVGIAPPHVGNLSRQPITTPPNVVQAMMGNLTGQQSLLMNQINAAAAATARRSQQQQSPQSSSFSKSQSSQLLMQNRTKPIFKPSLQKQLEQTILQQQKLGQSGLGFSPNLGGGSSSNSSGSNSKRSVGITSPHVGNLSRPPITTPPNVVQDMRGGQQSLLMNANLLSAASGGSTPGRRSNQILQQQQQQSTSFNKSQAAQMLLQKRNAAKAAIQKQLEQTLMQLPQKHIQLGIDFVPNANNIEFVYYVGLEACVDYLTGTKNPLNSQPLEKPFECSTCGTDFTPSWSWKRSNAVCENCVSNHVKKSIKNSQASRIKSVLAKAAKQEQDMDAKIMTEAANVVSNPSSPATTSSSQSQPLQQHSLLQPTASHQSRSTPQSWSRNNQSPLNVGFNNRANIVQQQQQQQQPPAPPVNTNPLAGIQPAALASLLQMNPQLSTLASLMTSNNNPTNNTNQFAQVAALLMNQLTMNLWKR